MEENIVCRTCKKEFVPSSRHKDCPSCRYQKGRTPCPICGKLRNPDFAICIDCHNKSMSGEKNANWRGGKTKHSGGYVMRLVPDHPRVKGKSNKYVMEHILVMEEAIGRILDPNENVHHKNGIKTDNRIENLELWTRSHPSGCRVSDLLEWAHYITDKYE